MKLPNILKVRHGRLRIALFALCLSVVFVACEKNEKPSEELPKSEVDIPGQLAKVSFVGTISEKELLTLDDGITLWNFRVQTTTGQPIALSILAIDLKRENIALHTITPDDGEAYQLQTVREMAIAADGPGHRVVAAINADYFYWTGEPWGPVVKRGNLIRSEFFDTWHGFFGIDNAGQLHIGSGGNFDAISGQLVEAVGGTERLISRGSRMHHQNSERHPRTVVGYNADQVVYLMVVDGRQPGYSIGMQLGELSEIMWAFGVSEALNLDGGGSSTLVLRDGTAQAFKLGNQLVDNAERAVANGLAVVRLSAN